MSATSAVELLRDGRGIYGIGVSDAFDFEALAWTCGIDPRDTWQTAHVQNLMLRPDMLRSSKEHKLSFDVHTVRYTELAPDRFKNFWRD